MRWCSQLSSNVFHFREHKQRSNQTYSLPWPQAVNIRCARYLAEVVREPGQRPCSIRHRRRNQLLPSPSFVPLPRLNRDQYPSSSVSSSSSQQEEEEEDEEDKEEDEVWLSLAKEDPAQEEQEEQQEDQHERHPKQQKEEDKEEEKEQQQEEDEEDLPGQRPCANPGHGPVPTLGYQLVGNRPQDEDHLQQERHPEQKEEEDLPGQRPCLNAAPAHDLLRCYLSLSF